MMISVRFHARHALVVSFAVLAVACDDASTGASQPHVGVATAALVDGAADDGATDASTDGASEEAGQDAAVADGGGDGGGSSSSSSSSSSSGGSSSGGVHDSGSGGDSGSALPDAGDTSNDSGLAGCNAAGGGTGTSWALVALGLGFVFGRRARRVRVQRRGSPCERP